MYLDRCSGLPLAIFLLGPTASGKTDCALQIARQWPVEVISVDSALIYRGMDIGTAKPDRNFLKQLPHFLIDIRNPDESYSAAAFRRDALELMEQITARGNIPLLVGGTMLYFKVLIEGIAALPPTDESIRHEVSLKAEELGWPAMYELLKSVDPDTASQLHPNHSQRIQRALEVFYNTGEPVSAILQRQQHQPLPYALQQFALWPANRQQLHRRIADRFTQMLEQNFLEEVRSLRQRFALTETMMSMRAVGYRQAWQYLDNRTSYDQFIANGIAATRQLAKRQYTWMRKWSEIERIEIDFCKSNLIERVSSEISAQIAERVH